MKVSLITVSYNSAKTIVDTLESVKAQTYGNIEYIIIDGNSSDGTVDIVRQFVIAKQGTMQGRSEGASQDLPEDLSKNLINVASQGVVTTFLCEPDNGIYDAMNKGLALATGDIIGVLNSDDFYCSNDVIEQVVYAFEENKTDCLYGDLNYVDPIDTTKIVRKWRSGSFRKENFLKGWMPPHPTFFVRKTCYEKFGKFDTRFKSAADYELMLRFLFKESCSALHLPKVMIHMRAGGISNVSLKNRIRANREDRLAWKINGLKPKWFTLLRKPLSKLLQYF
jgi:glycosyltransferase involved in cell wall biosynthesis